MKTKRRQTDRIAPRHLRRLWLAGTNARPWLSCGLPPLPPGATLAELDLPSRARKFFERERYVERPAAVAKLTVSDLLKSRGLGRGSVIAIIEALHGCAERRQRIARGGKNAARPLPAELAPRDLRRRLGRKRNIPNDLLQCRLPPLPPGATLGDLRLTGHALRFFRQGEYLEKPEALGELTIADVLDRRGMGKLTVVGIVEALYRCAEPERNDTTLEAEILRWLVPRGQPRRRRIVAQHYGFGRRQTRSLAALGASYGCSHERIRQICTPRTDPPTSVLRRFQAAVDATRALSPAPAAEIEARLTKDGGIEPGTKLEALSRIARLVGGETGFVINKKGPRRWALPAPSEATVRLRGFLKRLARSLTVLQTTHVAAQWQAAGNSSLDAATIEKTIDATPFARWLDRPGGWFWVDDRCDGMRRRLGKALAAAGRLTIAELEEAVWRGPAAKRWPRLPLSALAELCRQLPECRAEGDMVSAVDPNRVGAFVSGAERTLMEFLQQRGGVCDLEELQRFATGAGIGQASLWHCLQGSPTLKRYAPLRYGLPGL